MERWYRDAQVRSGTPLPIVSDEDPGLYFDPALQPHVTHPHVTHMGADVASELLRRALARYLHATSVLEVRVVNAVAAELAHGDLGGSLPTSVRAKALQLTCDEGFHAVVASRMLAQIGGAGPGAAPAFYTRLTQALAEHGRGDEDVGFIRFLFAVVTETSITENLRRLARSEAVKSGVRAFVAAHARDEAWHGAYFSSLFAALWRSLTEPERARYGALLPELIGAYLEPDVAAAAADLRALGLRAGQADEVVGESFAEVRGVGVRAAALPLLVCLQRADALRGPTRDALEEARLLPMEV